jgi:putative polyhydroxyalkanoate system protein
MPKYEVDIAHNLPADEAKQRLSGAAGKLERDYGAACTWKSERELVVSRKGLDARLTIDPTRVHIDLSLGFLLTPFAERIKNGIAKELANILSAPSSSPSPA